MHRPRLPVIAATLAGCLAVGGSATAVAVGHHHRGPAARPVASRALPAHTDRAHRSGPLVAPLHRLVRPDVLVELPHAATAYQLRLLGRTSGVRAVTALDRGTIRLGGTRLRTFGADIRSARGLTPQFTATSELLWSSIARGEVTLSYSVANRLGRQLGATLAVGGRAGTPGALRIGAFATIGLGSAQALVDRSLSHALGLRTRRVVVFAAPALSTPRLTQLAREVFHSAARVHVLRPAPVRQYVLSAYARAMIPRDYLRLYQLASMTCRGLPWTVLAAIGTVETHNGADTRTSSKGAMGPMQFLPSTWAAYGVDANGDGKADIMNPVDAIYSAARYLCAAGGGLGGQSLLDAIWAYNHADWYVREVVQLAIAYS